VPCHDDAVQTAASPFYLGIGSVFSESVISKLATAGSHYVSKLLQSGPRNWEQILHLLEREELVGAVCKLTGNDYGQILRPEFNGVAERLFARLGDVPHLVLVHEAVAGPPLVPDVEFDELPWNEDVWNDVQARAHFGDMDPVVQSQVHEILQRHNVAITTYKTNAEASVLASAFVVDLQDNLIFRIYVPAGRIYEDEMSRLLAMFHHWLGAVKGETVRQGGYQTASGRVIEFFRERDTSASSGIGADLAEFNEFLGLIDDAAAAAAMLVGLGVEPSRADELVARYSRDARRVLLDARHERDRKVLAIQQQLEAELTDEELSISGVELTRLVQSLVPVAPLTFPVAGNRHAQLGTGQPSIVVNQQIIQRVEGIVAQQVSGDIHYGTPLDQRGCPGPRGT
jgi:hypothetical protein